MFHSPFDQPSYGKKRAKKKAKARKKAPAKKAPTKKKRSARKMAKVKRAPAKKTKARKKTKIPRARPRKGGTWALTHMPTGMATVTGVKTKKALKQLAVDLGAIRGNRWGASFSTTTKLATTARSKLPKWFLRAEEITKGVRKNPHADPKWPGAGGGAQRWVREDVLVNSSDGLFVIEGEVLYPKRIWAISRSLMECTFKNPPLRQLLMFKSR